MTDERKNRLCSEWHRLHEEMDKPENTPAMTASFESSIARIEAELSTEDVDPRHWGFPVSSSHQATGEAMITAALADSAAQKSPSGGRPHAVVDARPASELFTHTETDVEMTCSVCQQKFLARCFEVMGVQLSGKVCPKCSHKIVKREMEQEELRRQQAVQRAIKQREQTWSGTCPKEFRLTSEDGGLTKLAELELRQPKLKDVLAWQGPKGLIIRGTSGACKTRSVWRLMRKLFVEGVRFKVLTAGQFDRQCRDAGGSFTLTEWFNNLAYYPVLVLDDLGNGAWTQTTEATWLDLVDERTRENRPIIVTTQHTAQTLTDSVGEDAKKLLRTEAIIRRLRDYCDIIVFQ